MAVYHLSGPPDSALEMTAGSEGLVVIWEYALKVATTLHIQLTRTTAL